jgi:hypothetical protein
MLRREYGETPTTKSYPAQARQNRRGVVFALQHRGAMPASTKLFDNPRQHLFQSGQKDGQMPQRFVDKARRTA